MPSAQPRRTGPVVHRRSPGPSVTRPGPDAPRRERAREGPGTAYAIPGPAQCVSTSLHVEAVGLHDLRPRGDEVVDELLGGVVARVDLGEGTQLGGGAEEQVDAAAGPRLLPGGVRRGERVSALVGRGPRRAELEQVDEEVVRQRADAVGEDTGRRATGVGPQDAQAADEDRHLRGREAEQVGPVDEEVLGGHATRLADVVAEAVVLRLEIA